MKKQIEKAIEDLRKLAEAFETKVIKVEINTPTVTEKPKENIDLMRDLTKEIEHWDIIYSTKLNLVKLQRFDLASELREMENRSIDAVRKIVNLFKSYPPKDNQP